MQITKTTAVTDEMEAAFKAAADASHDFPTSDGLKAVFDLLASKTPSRMSDLEIADEVGAKANEPDDVMGEQTIYAHRVQTAIVQVVQVDTETEEESEHQMVIMDFVEFDEDAFRSALAQATKAIEAEDPEGLPDMEALPISMHQRVAFPVETIMSIIEPLMEGAMVTMMAQAHGAQQEQGGAQG